MASDGRRWAGRLLWVGVAIVALVFAVEGGEYGTFDLLRQRGHRDRLSRSVDSLQRVVDSLKRYESLVMRDPATQERIAREEFGMVRGQKELVYRFDTAAAGTESAGRKRP
jgi:cell division protein FtsB